MTQLQNTSLRDLSSDPFKKMESFKKLSKKYTSLSPLGLCIKHNDEEIEFIVINKI